MNKAKDPDEILPPEPVHAYNQKGLSPKEFLTAIYQDEKVPLSVRMDAAAKVSVYEHPRLAQVSQDLTAGVTIRIEGGLPELPGTNIIMPKPGSVQPPIAAPKKGNGSDTG